MNDEAIYLLRSKPEYENEGGVGTHCSNSSGFTIAGFKTSLFAVIIIIVEY